MEGMKLLRYSNDVKFGRWCVSSGLCSLFFARESEAGIHIEKWLVCAGRVMS